MLGLTMAAAVVAGLILGLLGGGGSILTLPIVVYLAGMGTRPAIAASLFVVAATSAVALIPHARAGRVRWRVAAPFAVAGVAGAYAGGRVGDLLPGPLLLVGFAVMMIAAAAAMLRPRRPATHLPAPRPGRLGRSASLGGIVGLLTGLVGAGGGFIVVPVLTLLAGLTMSEAIGTSLFVIAVQSAAGLLGHLHSAHMRWPLTLGVTAAAVAGSLLGARLVGRVRQGWLRTAFGVLVAVMAAVILFQQAATVHAGLVVSLPGLFALAAIGTGMAVLSNRLRRRGSGSVAGQTRNDSDAHILTR